jgi:hypothetical protein
MGYDRDVADATVQGTTAASSVLVRFTRGDVAVAVPATFW